jgi:hypothetical protein
MARVKACGISCASKSAGPQRRFALHF